MSMLSERLQVLICVEQRERLEREANERGTSVATLVREAIDEKFPGHADRRAAAAEVILSAEPMDLGPIDEVSEELDQLRSRRR